MGPERAGSSRGVAAAARAQRHAHQLSRVPLQVTVLFAPVVAHSLPGHVAGRAGGFLPLASCQLPGPLRPPPHGGKMQPLVSLDDRYIFF